MYARVPSRKRFIAPGIIGAGVSSLSHLLNNIAQEKALKDQEDILNKKLFEDQKAQDAYSLSQYNQKGIITDYFANGGKLNNSNIPLYSKGKYETIGGNLKNIADGVQKVEGNKHGEKTIDNSYGVTLIDKRTGNPDAEVEGGEVLVDESTVFSDRLMYDKKHSFADKMEQLAKRRKALEEKLSKTKDVKDRNGIERQLAGMNMAEEVLFSKQEQVKEIEGNKELEALNPNIMANGGEIDPKKKSKNTKISKQDLSNVAVASDNGMASSSTVKPIVKIQYGVNNSRLGSGAYLYSRYPIQNVDTDREFVTIEGLRSLQGTQPYLNYLKSYNENTRTYNPTAIPKYGDGGKFLEELAPNLIDNVGNLALTVNSPRIPKARLAKKIKLNTDVNINPQVAEIKNTLGSIKDNILGNTSNSAVARANIASSKLKGLTTLNNLYADKTAKELELKNNQILADAKVDEQNRNIAVNNSLENFTRQNDIQSRLSANFTNLEQDIQNTISNQKKQRNYDESMLLELLDDPTGEKLRTIKRNPYFNPTPVQSKAIDAEMRRKGLTKKYNFNPIDIKRYLGLTN